MGFMCSSVCWSHIPLCWKSHIAGSFMFLYHKLTSFLLDADDVEKLNSHRIVTSKGSDQTALMRRLV